MAQHEMRLPENIVEAGTMIGMMHLALRTTLEQMAADHDYQGGEWFESLAEKLVREAKGMTYSGSHEVEAEAVSLGLELLQITLTVVREQLKT